MVEMIKEVLLQKLQSRIKLSFEPELEIQRQIATIYPNGDIDAVEAVQKNQAQEFKNSMLNQIFAAINAATDEQIKFELDTPGQNNPDSPLNTALHNFRQQFADLSNQEHIFNPFNLSVSWGTFKIYCKQKNQVWRTYAQNRRQQLPIDPAEQVRNSVRHSCCSIC